MNAELELVKKLIRPAFYELMEEYEAKRGTEPPEPVRKKLLRASEVAEILDVPVKQVYRLVAQRRLSKVPNLGRRVRFDPEEVERVKREGFAQSEEKGAS